MKKFLSIFILIFLFFPLISSVELSMEDNFQQGETAIAKVSGNFITQITRENVFFYREHVRVPMDWGIAKISDEYYIYAILQGKEPGNYSISIQGVKYMEGAQIIENNIAKNFTISDSLADFSLNPGVVVTSGDFYVEVQNLKNSQITINVNTQPSNTSARSIFVSTGSTSASVSVKSGEIKRIYFTLGAGNPSLETIELRTSNITYEFPVYITTSSEIQEAVLRLEPSELILSIPTNLVTKRTVYVYNTGGSEIKNISFSLSESIILFANLSDSHIEKLDAKSNYPIELSFSSPGEIEVSGSLKVNINSENILYSKVGLKFLNNYIPANETQTSSDKTCTELGGRICSSTEACSQQTVYAKDNVCCPGTCTSTAKKSSVGTIIAIIIFVVIIGVGFWFYKKKFKKAKKSVDLLKEAKGKKLVSFWTKK